MTSNTTHTVDWEDLANVWGHEPARLSAPVPMDPRRCFDAIRTASAPFRTGTRAFAVPDVRFFTVAGRLRAPADGLPAATDPGASAYLDRVTNSFHPEGWMLEVEHPLLVDFTLWSFVRDMLSGLWRRIGWPVMPVVVNLAAGHGYTRTSGLALPPKVGGLVWVIAGTTTVRLWQEDGHEPDAATPELELHGKPGDLLYWPAQYRFAELFADRCVTMRLDVRAEHRAAMATVKNLLIDMVQETAGYADDHVSHLPYPPAIRPDGSTPDAEPIRAVGSELHRFAAGEDLERRLRHRWAARRSAAGLEPVPPPLAASALDHDDRIRVTAEIVRVPDGPNRVTWAVNGHLVPIAGATGDRVRAALRPGTQIGVTELSRAVGAGERNDAVLTLLRTLHRLRAVSPIPANRAEPGAPL